jgi:glycyl-tRNA synthetase beta chain
VVSEATAFILERLAKSLTDEGLARDTVDAVLLTSRDLLDLRARAEALHRFRSEERWDDLVTVFTRPANLARQLSPQEAAAASALPLGGVSSSLFQAEVESGLLSSWQETREEVSSAVAEQGYAEALAALAALRTAIDRYFDEVLVMAEDKAVRLNRLRQLAAITATVRSVACLELIQG